MCDINNKNQDTPKEDRDITSIFQNLFLNNIIQDHDALQLIKDTFLEQNPNIKYDDIIGLDYEKTILQEKFNMPHIQPNQNPSVKKFIQNHILIYGPPGSGKTLIAKYLISSNKTTFFNVPICSLLSKFSPANDMIVRLLFQAAKAFSPSVILLDDIDMIVSNSDYEHTRTVKSKLLIELDNVIGYFDDDYDKKIAVLAVTNKPWKLDRIIMRRFEKKVYIPLLNGEGRKKLIEKFLGFNRYDSNSFDWDYLVASTQGYTGADILCLCRDAAMMSIRKHIQILEVGFDCPIPENDIFVTMENMIEALNRVSKSISSEELEKYESWAHETS